MKKLAIGLVLLACVSTSGVARGTQQPDAWILEDIEDFRDVTWHYQRTMGVRRTPYANTAARRDVTKAYRLWVRSLWRVRAVKTKQRFAVGPPHRSAWLCIHRHERHDRQGWRTNTGNGYYGGLQMDHTFMRTYGPHLLRRKGTADRWTPVEQMWVAEKAYRSGRGFHPWPRTARACGLL